jgi:teichuronic acid biosynthesis protein TuaE
MGSHRATGIPVPGGREGAMAYQTAVTTAGTTKEVRPGALACAVLFALPVLAAIGGRLPGIPVAGANLFAFRLAVMAGAFFPLLVDPRLRWLEDGAARFYVLVTGVWLFWGGLGLFWAAGTMAAVVDILGVAFGFLTVLTLANLRASTETGIRWLFRGWVAAALMAGVVAMWEFNTGQHLPGSWVNNTRGNLVQRFVVVSTFDNPNNYGAFLLLVSAVVLYQMETAASWLRRWGLFLFLLWMFVLAVLTTSRVALIGVLAVIVVYLMNSVKNKVAAVALVAVVFGGIIGALTYWAGDLALVTDMVRMSADDLISGRSSGDRIALLRAGLAMTAASYGFGVGGGNFSVLMDRGYVQYQSAGVVDPHNWWIEILSQYGVLVFVLYVAFLGYVAWFSVRSYRAKAPSARFLMAFVLAFVLSGFANSSYVLQTTNWLFLGTILMLASRAKQEMRRDAAQTDVADA